MSTVETIIRLVAGSLLVLANAFFVVTEFALTRVPQFDKSEFQEHAGLRRAWEMTERLEIYLTGCQLGISSTSIVLGIVAEPAVSELIAPLLGTLGLASSVVPATSVVLAVVLINLIHKIWGEQAPTYLGVERPKQIVRWAAPVHYWWTKIMYPFIILGDGLAKWTLRLFGVEITRSWTEEETEGSAAGEGHPQEQHPLTSIGALRREMGEVLRRGTLPRDRQEEVLKTLEIEEMPVREVMVRRSEIAALHADADIEQNLVHMRQHPFNRFPLIGASWEAFHGIVYTAEVFRNLDALEAGCTSFRDLAHTPVAVAADTPVSALIDLFQARRQERALVKEGEEVVGLVIVTDAFEAIAGQVEDPLDKPGLDKPEAQSM